MGPFYEAVRVHRVRDGEYTGDIDAEWAVGAVPHGGYLLALVLQACIDFQRATAHKDAIHVTAHYLRATSIAPFSVRVSVVKKGKGLTNLSALLIQNGETNISTQLVFGTLSTGTKDASRPTLANSSNYARRIPLHRHPGDCERGEMTRPWMFKRHAAWSIDKEYEQRNLALLNGSKDSERIGGNGLEWGGYFCFKGEEERITTPSLAFLVDIFTNLPGLLPKEERPGLKQSWFPTVVMTLHFHAPIPPVSSQEHARRTAGIYHSGKYMHDGRHDAYVEIWTAPSELGAGVGKAEKGKWRERQVCLATSTQMALTIPMEVNMRMKKSDSKL